MRLSVCTALCVLGLSIAACGSRDPGTVISDTSPFLNPTPDLKGNAQINSVTVVTATLAQCPAGGAVVETFRDINQNGILDGADTVISSFIVCSGVAGAQGYGAGIIIADAIPAACPAGGSVFKTFQDKNNNNILDGDESLASFTTICNGVNGSNGSSAHLSLTPATSLECSAGGTVYSSSVDGQIIPDVTVVCNGMNGANGSNGSNGNDAHFQMGAVGPQVVGKSYSACHHDFLFLPSESGNRGWLTFRHQANGSADQGIGATGFQIWNVDIADFSLASEVGGVNYCNLHWNPNTKVLQYTVNDNSDGLAGVQGTLQF